MQPIIAGRFESMAQADSTALQLTNYINTNDICIFYNNPPGQHDVLLAGGDEKIDPGAKDAHASAIKTGATAGLTAGAIGLFAGPVVALAAAGIGAYTGSLIGALQGTESNESADDPIRREAGVILAVHVTNPRNEEMIVSMLEDAGAMDIEHAHGEWRNGDWVDFDPTESPKLDNKVTTH